MLEKDTILNNRYRVVRCLGQGVESAVYQTEDTLLLNTFSAIKVFQAPASRHAELTDTANYLAYLEHPALPRVNDYFTNDDNFFLVMNFVPGEDLGAALEQHGAFDLAEVMVWGDKLLDAVNFLHGAERPIIHGDIRPRNLKLLSGNRLMLLDWALFQNERSADRSDAPVVRSAYKSLGQLDDGWITERSDLYSTAATLYHLATGVRPPDAYSRGKALLSGQRDPLRPADEVKPKIGRGVSAVFERALALEVQEPLTAAEMRAALRAVAGTPIARPIEPAQASPQVRMTPHGLINNRYRLGDPIGFGATGRVYEAVDEHRDRRVAIKKIRFEDDDFKQAMNDQAEILLSLNHASLPRVIDSFTDENIQFLVMELIEGKDLVALLRSRDSPFPISQVLEWADQLLDALDYLHLREPPVLHNDIKPTNLKLTSGGQLVLFGLSPAKSLTGGGLYGTPTYTSPEQIEQGKVSRRSDLYSLGMTLFHLMTGLTPADALTRLIAIASGAADPLRPANELNPGVPAAIAEIIQKSASMKREERPTSAAEMRQALRHAKDAMAEAPNSGGGENASARLRYAIENKFPYPIARPFYQLRMIDDWKAQIPQLANILGAVLEHLAVVSLAEYFASDVRDRELNGRLTEAFKKPISHGLWAGILRETNTFLHEQFANFCFKEFPELYFGQNHAMTSLKVQGDELVTMRNQLIKRSVDASPGHADYLRFKRRLIEFLQSMAVLKDYPLLAVTSTQIESGIKTHRCDFLVGSHEAFEQVELECDLDLERMRVMMVNPAAREALYLYPFYVLRECPEDGCQATHFFRFDRTARNRIEYVATGGHRLSDATAFADLRNLFQGPWGMQPGVRQRAKYLCLEFSDSWQQRAAGDAVAGKYQIVQHLRRGGMADVYEAKAPDNESRALKLLPFQFLSDQKMIHRFRQEAMQARSLEHPNITRVFDYGEDLVDHYLVMELADGWQSDAGNIALDVGELPKPLNEDRVLAIIKQACEGLDYIHSQRIIHRDIKPGNLLLFADQRVKVGDFGIARSHESITLTMTGLAMGTPEYMSPEQAEGRRDLSFASDIYSLGVVIYELLAGQPPFKRSTPLATAVAHLRDPVPSLTQANPKVLPELERIVMKCLEKEPADRYESVRGLYQELDRYERGDRKSAANRDLAVRLLEKTLTGHEGAVNSLAFAPDGSRLVSGGYDNTIRIWNVQSEKAEASVKAHEREVTSVLFAPDGGLIMSGSLDQAIRLWDAATLELQRTLTWEPELRVDTLAFSPDGRLAAAGGETLRTSENQEAIRSGEICVWDGETFELKHRLTGHSFSISSLAFAPDSRTLASCGWDQAIRLWDVSGGGLERTLSGHQGSVHRIAFSPQGVMLASAGEDQTVKLWDSVTGGLMQTLPGHSSRVLALAFSPAGDTLASGGGEHGKWGEVKLWDLPAGKLRQTLRGHTGAVLSLAFSPHGELLATASSDGTIGLWELQQTANRAASKRALWVTHDPDRHSAIIARLHNSGMKILFSASAEEAAAMLQARTVDFIISDLAAEPATDEANLALIRSLRNAGIDLPIYVFNHDGDPQSNSDELIASGGNGYVRFDKSKGALNELPPGKITPDEKAGSTGDGAKAYQKRER